MSHTEGTALLLSPNGCFDLPLATRSPPPPWCPPIPFLICDITELKNYQKPAAFKKLVELAMKWQLYNYTIYARYLVWLYWTTKEAHILKHEICVHGQFSKIRSHIRRTVKCAITVSSNKISRTSTKILSDKVLWVAPLLIFAFDPAIENCHSFLIIIVHYLVTFIGLCTYVWKFIVSSILYIANHFSYVWSYGVRISEYTVRVEIFVVC